MRINVNYDVADKYGWLADETKAEIEHDKANNPSLYAHKWLGEPISQDDMSIIPRDMILEAMNRHADNDGAWEVGVDVARMGNDRTVFWSRKGMRSIDSKVLTKLRTTQVCDELEKFVRFDKVNPTLKIDDSGVRRDRDWETFLVHHILG